MTADAQHRSPDAPPSSSTAPMSGEPPWATPFAAPTAHDEGPVARRPHRLTALVASGALAIGLIGGVGIGRVTAPAAQGSGTSAGGFPQGGPGGTGFPRGAQGQGGAQGGTGAQGGLQGGTGTQGGTGLQGAPADPGGAAASGQGGQLDQSGQVGAAPGSSDTGAQTQDGTST
ncbi:MAG: hypothetical protein PGN11_13140 [Quadrisphaera sp.]